MLNLWKKLFDNQKRNADWERRHFAQYVGDETILMCGKDDLFIYLDGCDASLTPSLLRDGQWEPAISRFFDNLLSAGDCFIDIGANNGIHSLRAGKIVGKTGLVLAFEPQQRLLKLMQRSIAANLMEGRIYAYRMAIGAEEASVNLGKFEHFTGSATLTRNTLIVESEQVPMAPLPRVLAQIAKDIDRVVQPRLIKIDVEGFECDVWDGMKIWAREQPNLTIVMEYSPVSYRDQGRNPLDLLDDIVAHGFTISRLSPDGIAHAIDRTACEAMAGGQAQFDLVLTSRF